MPDAAWPEALWSVPLGLAQVQRAAPVLELSADAPQRAAIARALDLLALDRFEARVEATPWLDGMQIEARWSADVTQTCGVSLEPFDTALNGRFMVRVVPPGSPAAVDPSAEIAIDPEAEDPPDTLEGEAADVGAYLVEHLALDIDPFPRRPGASFTPPPDETPASPFAVLRALKPGSETDR